MLSARGESRIRQGDVMPNAKFIKNKKGQKVSVVISIEEYEKLMDDLDELDAIRAYDAAKASGETTIPYAQVLKKLEDLQK